MRVLPLPVGPKKKEVADWTARRAHPGEVHLVDIDDLLNRFILANDISTKRLI